MLKSKIINLNKMCSVFEVDILINELSVRFSLGAVPHFSIRGTPLETQCLSYDLQ